VLDPQDPSITGPEAGDGRREPELPLVQTQKFDRPYDAEAGSGTATGGTTLDGSTLDLWVNGREVAPFVLPQTFASTRRSSRLSPLRVHLEAMSADLCGH
jgi:hypothetical protein